MRNRDVLIRYLAVVSTVEKYACRPLDFYLNWAREEDDRMRVIRDAVTIVGAKRVARVYLNRRVAPRKARTGYLMLYEWPSGELYRTWKLTPKGIWVIYERIKNRAQAIA